MLEKDPPPLKTRKIILVKSAMRSSIQIVHIHLLRTDKMQTPTDTVDAKFLPRCGLKTDPKALAVLFLSVVLLLY